MSYLTDFRPGQTLLYVPLKKEVVFVDYEYYPWGRLALVKIDGAICQVSPIMLARQKISNADSNSN